MLKEGNKYNLAKQIAKCFFVGYKTSSEEEIYVSTIIKFKVLSPVARSH